MTPNKNNASIIRKDLLIRLCKVYLSDDISKVDRIPLDIKPKTKEAWRCCVYKDRAVLKYKLMALLGYSELDETDELTPLMSYAVSPNGHNNFYINLISEACSNCPSNHYEISNYCRACDARPCQINCPKNAISFRNGKAEIDSELCVNCGKCQKECPFNAIHYQKSPCQEACPVNAIYQDEFGNETIDMDKCILCGKCMQECPFGAIIPSSVLPQIIKDIKAKENVIALVAPSIASQFREKLSTIYGSVKKLGFSEIYEVAWGAEQTAKHETKELNDILEQENSTPLISSCCPSWVDYAAKSKFDYNKYISHTASPLVYTAEKARKDNPDAKLVFIAPCIAKKRETELQTDCDYCISFEELGAYLVAAEVEISEQNDAQPIILGNETGKNFAEAGGVAKAIENTLDREVRIAAIDGLNKANQRAINQMLKKNEFDFLEVMSCEGGCLGGCQSLTSPNEGKRIFNKSK